MRIQLALVAPLLLLTACGGSPDPAQQQVAVVFTGGHDTDPRDNGRPVVLIAAALGVEPQVFREAFSGVRPAALGTTPGSEQVTANKAVLLAALSSYGITNARLDTVSNHYRYDASAGRLWPTESATAKAFVKDHRVVRVVVTSGGSGYTTTPVVSVPGYAVDATVGLALGADLSTNGSVTSVAIR
jgi:hypothetical protein